MAKKSKEKEPAWKLLIEFLGIWFGLAGNIGITEMKTLCSIISRMILSDDERLNVLKKLRGMIEYADQPSQEKLTLLRKTTEELSSKGVTE